ncbi:MAG: redoxin domain-containing protein [Bacteroidales bacterium]|nr:redoxin domain-containing protein [Candidatus Scybalocola fimicaballi]
MKMQEHLVKIKCALSLVLMMSCVCPTHAAKIVVSGKNESYAGETLELRTYTEKILNSSGTIATAKVDKDGDFKFEFDLTKESQIFLPGDAQRGYMYVEPGKSYVVEIPNKRSRTLSEKLQPYFEPNEYLFFIQNPDKKGLNMKVLQFEDAYDFFTMKTLASKGDMDTVQYSVKELNRIFSDMNTKFQKGYVDYRCLLLKAQFSDPVQMGAVYSEFSKLGVDKTNPAFWDLFNNVFYNLIPNTVKSEDFYVFKKIIETTNAKMLLMHLQERYKLTDTELKELAAIKIVGDLAAADIFDNRIVVKMLQNLSAAMTIADNKELALNVAATVGSTLVGEGAPNLVGNDLNGKKHELTEFLGKYIYLNICNSRLMKTEKDLKILDRFQETFEGQLQVVNIFVYDDKEHVEKVTRGLSGKMQVWMAPESDVLRKIYNARAIPSYYLIDNEGKFVLLRKAEPNDELRYLLLNIFDNNK